MVLVVFVVMIVVGESCEFGVVFFEFGIFCVICVLVVVFL